MALAINLRLFLITLFEIYSHMFSQLVQDARPATP